MSLEEKKGDFECIFDSISCLVCFEVVKEDEEDVFV